MLIQIRSSYIVVVLIVDKNKFILLEIPAKMMLVVQTVNKYCWRFFSLSEGASSHLHFLFCCAYFHFSAIALIASRLLYDAQSLS